MANYPELKGKSVLVTGAGRGIGLAIARRFVEEGSHVMLTDVAEGESATIVELAANSASQAAYHELDVTSREEVEAAISRAVDLCLAVSTASLPMRASERLLR